MLSVVSFMALKNCHQLLLKKKKKEDYENIFPNLENALAQIKARLTAHSAQWDKLSYNLTEAQHKTRRKVQTEWMWKAKNTRVQDISNFVYKL